MEGLSRGYTKMKKEIIQNEKRKRQEDGKYEREVTKQEGQDEKVQHMPIRTPEGENTEDGREESQILLLFNIILFLI